MDDDGPVAGATVSIYLATPPIATTTDSSGVFTFVASGKDPYILVEAPAHWGNLTQIRWDGELRDDLEIDLPSDSAIAEIGTTLGRTLLASNGVLEAQFIGPTLGGESMMLTPPGDPAFTFDENEEPVESDTIFSGPPEADLIYTNIPVGENMVFAVGSPTSRAQLISMTTSMANCCRF